MYCLAIAVAKLYSESVVHRCYGKVIRLHGDIVFTRETNCKLELARETSLEVGSTCCCSSSREAAIPRVGGRARKLYRSLAETSPLLASVG